MQQTKDFLEVREKFWETAASPVLDIKMVENKLPDFGQVVGRWAAKVVVFIKHQFDGTPRHRVSRA